MMMMLFDWLIFSYVSRVLANSMIESSLSLLEMQQKLRTRILSGVKGPMIAILLSSHTLLPHTIDPYPCMQKPKCGTLLFPILVQQHLGSHRCSNLGVYGVQWQGPECAIMMICCQFLLGRAEFLFPTVFITYFGLFWLKM